MIISIGGLVGALFIVLELVGYFGARSFALSELEQEGGLLARYQAERVRASLAYAETTSEFLHRILQLYDQGTDNLRIERLLADLLNGNPQVSAVEIRGLPMGPVALRRTVEGQVVPADAVFDSNSISQWSVQHRNEGRWVIASRDPEATHIRHVQVLSGITVVVEVPIRLLAAPLEQTGGGAAYGFLATSGTVLFTSSTEPETSLLERADFISGILLSNHRSGEFYRVEDPIYGRPAWVGTAPVGDLDLAVGVVYLEGDNFRPLYGLAGGTLLIISLGLISLLVVLRWTAGAVARPLVELAQTVDGAVREGFSRRVEIPVRATREVEQLTQSFNRMLDDIDGYVSRLEVAAEERQAMESELTIAAKIQASILPNFPQTMSNCEAVGVSLAAQKVGGDFLSIFPVGSDSVGFFLGDVSGKGIPAAITMAFTASLLEHLGRIGVPPTECFRAVNQALCARDESGMFVTVFFGVLDSNGLISYANAGHQPPVLFSGSATYECVELEADLPLGVFEASEYTSGSFQLKADQRLMLYTDGVTEAMNKRKEEFGEARLETLVRGFQAEQTLAEQLQTLQEEVDNFRDGFSPNDDMTVLLLQPAKKA